MLWDDYFNNLMVLYPNLSTFVGLHKYDNAFENDISNHHIKLTRQFLKDYLNKAKVLKKNLKSKNILNKQSLFYTNILIFTLKDSLNILKYKFNLLPLNQVNNEIIDFVEQAKGDSFFRFKTLRDYKNFISRTKFFIEWCRTAVYNMKKGIKNGIVMPKIIMKQVLDQLSFMVKHKKYKHKKTIPKYAIKEFKQVVYNDLINEIKKVIYFLKNEYIPKCRNTLGLCYLPNGKKMYKAVMNSYTTTMLNPENIYKLGQLQVKRVHKELKMLEKKYKFNKKSISTRSYFFKTNKEILKAYHEAREFIKKNILPDFLTKKLKISHDSKILKVPKEKEKVTSGAYYMMPNIDRSRKGRFYINLQTLDDHPKNTVLPLSAHEDIPGHHFQMTYHVEKKVPHFLLFGQFTAYVEGWGLYSESAIVNYYRKMLKTEKNNKKKQEYAIIIYGALQFEMLRSLRLIIDTGIHYYGWNFKKCETYFKKYTNMTYNDYKKEIYRYVSYPGQACAYKIGEMEMQRLKKKYVPKKMTLGKFNEKILKYGPIPIHYLKRIV